MLRLTARGPAVVLDDEWIAQQSEFARRHCVVFENFVDAPILERVPRWCETSRYFTREDVEKNRVFARELTMLDSEPLTNAFFLLLNQPRLFAAIAEFTGSETPIRSFMGRCFKSLPGGEHFDSWHSDARGAERLYGLTIDLSPNPFVGGHFQIRCKETRRILHTVTTSLFGDACLFRIHDSLQHRATTVQGVRPRYCYAGWFSGTRDYRKVYRAAARPCIGGSKRIAAGRSPRVRDPGVKAGEQANRAAESADLRTAALLRPGGLLDQAEAVLRRTLAAHPHDTKALRRLGDILRGKGAFPAALDTYRRLHASGSRPSAEAWLVSILRGGRVPHTAPPGPRPVPFVRLTNFLTPTQQQRLWTQIPVARERFVPAKVGKDDLNRKVRTAWVANRRVVREVRPWFGPKLRSVLPHVLARLRMEALHRSRIEMDVTVHLGGEFYGKHRDNAEDGNRPRKLSYVYYFHRQPRPFAGGDLLLYDTDLETSRATAAAFTRIEPLHNSLVVFPSDAYHEITPVECDTRDFLDGRFTVNGWVRSQRKDGAGG